MDRRGNSRVEVKTVYQCNKANTNNNDDNSDNNEYAKQTIYSTIFSPPDD